MPAAEAFIDSNLLVLLAVGSVDRSQVGRHRRARSFVPEDYDRLVGIVDALERVLVTPTTLTEASNLLESRNDCRFLAALRLIVEESEEVVVASADAVCNRAFLRLGLADVVLLEAISKARPLFTTDLDLFRAATAREAGAAFNFTHAQALSRASSLPPRGA